MVSFRFVVVASLSLASSALADISCPASDGAAHTIGGTSFTVECFKDHYAGDLKGLYTNTFEDCLGTCKNTTGCVGVSYIPGKKDGPCYMKKAWKLASENTKVWAASINAAAPVAPAAAPSTSSSASSVASSTSTSSSSQVPSSTPPTTASTFTTSTTSSSTSSAPSTWNTEPPYQLQYGREGVNLCQEIGYARCSQYDAGALLKLGKCWNIPEDRRDRVVGLSPNLDVNCMAYEQEDCTGYIDKPGFNTMGPVGSRLYYPGVVNLEPLGLKGKIRSLRCCKKNDYSCS